MGRVSGLIIFVSLVLLVLGGLHFYLWVRLVRDPQLAAPWRSIVSAGLVLAAVSLPATFVLRRKLPAIGAWVTWPAFTWLGLMFLLVVVVTGSDLLRVVLALVRHATGAEPTNGERRLFLSRWFAGGALVTASGLGAVAMRSALGPVAVKRVEISLPRLARRQDGLTVVQLTDLHVGPTIGRSDIADLVNRTNQMQPDVVAITGDLVDGSVAELGPSVAPLADLKARYGVFFVTGNHEYFSGASEWVSEVSRLGIRVLRNERVTIGNGADALELAGVDDRSAARYPAEGHGEDLAKALKGRDPKRAVVLLAHQPRSVLDSSRYGVDLQLSGHTHGGQIWPFGALVRLQQHFLAGLGRHGDTIIYVSRGTGYWGPPMRLLAPAEITQIVLKAVAT